VSHVTAATTTTKMFALGFAFVLSFTMVAFAAGILLLCFASSSLHHKWGYGRVCIVCMICATASSTYALDQGLFFRVDGAVVEWASFSAVAMSNMVLMASPGTLTLLLAPAGYVYLVFHLMYMGNWPLYIWNLFCDATHPIDSFGNYLLEIKIYVYGHLWSPVAWLITVVLVIAQPFIDFGIMFFRIVLIAVFAFIVYSYLVPRFPFAPRKSVGMAIALSYDMLSWFWFLNSRYMGKSIYREGMFFANMAVNMTCVSLLMRGLIRERVKERQLGDTKSE